MSLSAQLFGRDSFIHRATNVLGLGIPTWLDKKFGPQDISTSPTIPTVQDSAYGNPIPRLYGTLGIAGNIIWLKGGKLDYTVKKKKSGGKGGQSQTAPTYSFFATFALSLGEGEIAGIRRIWCSDKLIYNAGSDDMETIIASNQAAKGWTLYRGTDDQLPDPDIQADKGVDNTPAYRGLAYIKFKKFALKNYGDSLAASQFKVEVVNAAEFITPTYHSTFSYLGEPVYTDQEILQTAQSNPGQVVNWGSPGAKFIASVTFRTYSITTGALIKEEERNATINAEGSNSLTFYKSLFWRGMKNGVFASRLGGSQSAIVIDDGGVEIPVDNTTRNSAQCHFYSNGRYWIPASSSYYTYDGATATLVNRTITGTEHQTICFAKDPVTDRMFRRRHNSTTGVHYLAEINESTTSTIWEIALGTGDVWGANYTSIFTVYDSKIAFVAGNIVGVVDADTHQIVGSLPSAGGPENLYSISNYFGVDASGLVYRIDYQQDAQLETLASIITRECELSSLIGVSDIDVSMLTQEVRGFRVAGGSIRSVIETLRAGYPFDARMHGYKLQFVPRGQSSIASIPWGDLSATDGEEIGDSLPYDREMDTQLPSKVTAKGISSIREYADSSQTYERIGTQAVNTETIDLGLVLSDDDLAQIAEKICELRWMEREAFSFALPPTYQYLEPGDVCTIAAKFGVFEIRLTEVSTESNGIVTCKGYLNNAALYTSNAVGASPTPPSGDVGLVGSSLFVPLDIPVVDETIQNEAGYVGSMTGYSNAWPGGIAVRSIDGGQTWNEIQAFSGKATIGTARDVLSVNSGILIDETSIRVDLISGEMESITRDQMLSGHNYAAYGVDGRWEIVRFQNAALQPDGGWQVSKFVRGDKGTEWATGLHASGDYFILLDDPDNIFIGSAIGSIGVPSTFRAVTSGGSIDDAEDLSFTYQGVNLECLSPVFARGLRDGSGNFSGTFYRRSRLSSSWWTNGVEAPVGESTEAYQIDVLSGATVKRTISVTSTSWSYSSADQTTDFGSAQASIKFRLYQLSANVGRGYVLEITL